MRGPAPEHPLSGVQVVDAGAFLAGPLGPMLLSDLGADVVKVEPPGGEGMRWVEWSFFGCQRGKRGVALDLKSPDARVALDALLARADILHHNLRMPAARRLGLDEATVRAVNPDTVYCHASSYGPEGLRADWPGYDHLFQSSCHQSVPKPANRSMSTVRPPDFAGAWTACSRATYLPMTSASTL